MIWLIVYVVGAALVAAYFLNDCKPLITLKDFGFAFVLGLLWFLTIFIVIAIWWDEHKDDVLVDTSNWFKNEENKEN